MVLVRKEKSRHVKNHSFKHYLSHVTVHSLLNYLYHKIQLNLSFLSPKRFINDIGNTSAFDTEFLTALRKFYAKRQGVSLDSVAVE